MRLSVPLVVSLLVPISFGAALYFGSVSIDAGAWRQLLGGRGDTAVVEIVWGLRAPRALAAFACGGLLALAGALMQVLLRNPLADPYILGVSGGAAVGALGAMLFGLSAWAVNGAAFLGAGAATLALLAFSVRLTGWQIHRVMLTGVALASGCAAVIALILTLAPAGRLHGMLFWLMGDLSAATDPWPAWIALAGVLALSLALSERLDKLALGTLKAASLGVPIALTQTLAFLAATGATVVAVLLAGAVGFVGLVVPHLLRLAGVSRHRALLPLCTAAGGVLLTLADTVARSAAAPLEFPVGAMTAIVGVPVLLVLLARSR